MPVVKLPDGTPVTFPDDTPPDVMVKAMQTHWWKHNDRRAAMDVPKAPAALPKQGEEYSPAGDFLTRRGTSFSTDMSNFAAGAGQRVDQTIDALTGLFLTDPKTIAGHKANVADKRRIGAPLDDTTAGTLGGIAADVAATAIPAGKAVDAAKLVTGPLKQTLAKYAGAAGLSAGYNVATKPLVEGETQLGNATEGALTGMVGQAVGDTGAKIIKGIVTPSARAQELPKEVWDKATLGQVADRKTIGGRFIAGTEEKLKSLPLIGDVIAHARKRGVDAWRDDVLAKASPESFKFSDKAVTMRDKLGELQDAFTEGYSGALAGNRVGPSKAFEARVLKRTANPQAGLTPAQQEEVRKMAMDYYQSMYHGTPTARLTPDELAAMEKGAIPAKRVFGREPQNTIDFDHIEDFSGEPIRKQIPVDRLVPSESRLFPGPLKEQPFRNRPIDVTEGTDGYYYVGDGNHRAGAAVMRGDPTIDAEIYGRGTPPKDWVNGAPPLSATAEQAKKFEAFLAAKARGHRMSNNPDAQQYAKLFEELEGDWTSAYRSQLPLSTRQQLRPLDNKYAPYKRVERASSYVGNEEGDFLPSQLLTSVKAQTPKAQFARGGGLLQDEADMGKAVFQDRIPNSGTVDRGLATGAGAAMFLDPYSTIGLGSAMALPVGMFASKSGKNFMTGNTKAQLLLQKLRADKALEKSGVGFGQSIEDLLEQ